MKWSLGQDYEIFQADDRASALEVLSKEKPAVVTLDLGLPPRPNGVEEGFRALEEMLKQDGLVKVIIITGQGEKDHALKAVDQGAYDFFCKPIQIDELKVVLSRAFHLSQLEMQNRELQQRVGQKAFEEMLGTSPEMQEVFAAIRKVATTSAWV
jgi:two-component system NtrC family response regulator